jgi:hypothetical protein
VGALEVVACSAAFGVLPRVVLNVILWAVIYLLFVQSNLAVAVSAPDIT